MQIHELNSFVGSPGASDYLAIDDGSETFKVGADNLGVTTVMTQNEAETGTSTASRVVTPKMLHDYVASVGEVLIVTASSVSSLPATISNANITTDMVCIKAELTVPSAQTGDWAVDTNTAGQAKITGTISGTTDITLYLMKSR